MSPSRSSVSSPEVTSSNPSTIVGVVVAVIVLLLIAVMVCIAIVISVVLLKRKKKKEEGIYHQPNDIKRDGTLENPLYGGKNL